MKTKFDFLCFSIVMLWACPAANAVELNVGKETPTAGEIVSHFTAPGVAVPVADSESSASGEDGAGQMQGVKTRSLIIKPVARQGTQAAKPAKTPIIDAASLPGKTRQDEVAFSMEVLFDYNSADLSNKAKEQLEPVAQALTAPEMKGLRFKIEGHTDASGSDDYNINLSLRRAEAVKEFLAQHPGVDSSVIDVEGKGKYGLANPTDPTSEENRRVRLVKLGG